MSSSDNNKKDTDKPKVKQNARISKESMHKRTYSHQERPTRYRTPLNLSHRQDETSDFCFKTDISLGTPFNQITWADIPNEMTDQNPRKKRSIIQEYERAKQTEGKLILA